MKLRDVMSVVTAVATIGTAVGALVAAFELEDGLVTMPRSEIVIVSIVAHVPGTDFQAWEGLHKFAAPQVPAQAQTYSLGDLLTCSEGYKPVAAWHEIVGSWPTIDVIYTVNAGISESGVPEVALRTRQGYERGYAYVEIHVRCHLEAK